LEIFGAISLSKLSFNCFTLLSIILFNSISLFIALKGSSSRNESLVAGGKPKLVPASTFIMCNGNTSV
jgi:hypothetical protein